MNVRLAEGTTIRPEFQNKNTETEEARRAGRADHETAARVTDTKALPRALSPRWKPRREQGTRLQTLMLRRGLPLKVAHSKVRTALLRTGGKKKKAVFRF